MATSSRILAAPVFKTLPTRMAFIGGPRQVGKTTLALHAIGEGIEASETG